MYTLQVNITIIIIFILNLVIEAVNHLDNSWSQNQWKIFAKIKDRTVPIGNVFKAKYK